MSLKAIGAAGRRELEQAAVFIRALSGWRKLGLAFVAGLLSALAFAPFGIIPLLLIAFAVLVLLIDGAHMSARPIRNAALAGWALGFGQFLAGLYWVGYAFMVDPAADGWQMPFAVVLLCGGLALFPALACAVAAKFWREGVSRIFLFGAAYAATEWLRGHMFTGFPWNLAAYGWGWSPGILQSTSVVGAYGLTLLTILFGAALAELCSARRRAFLVPLAFTSLFIAMAVAGEVRLALTPTIDVPGVHLRIVQPNVAQREKYQHQYIVRNWTKLVDLSIAKAKTQPTHIIWPEAAPPFLLAREPAALDDITVLTASNRVLVTGAQRVDFTPGGNPRFFNSVYIFAYGGKALDVYDKFHLVPFGEYVPFAAALASLGIRQLAGPTGFTAGDGPHIFAVPGAPPMGPLICYEVVFPGGVVGTARPGWFVNLTDDSWFGPSTGPYQHLLTARVRAIEEGVPIARAANTGISAVIDPLGRVTASLGLGQTGVLDAELPRALGLTLYARIGDLGFFMILILSVVGAIWSATKARS